MREIKFRAWVKELKKMIPIVGVDPFTVNDLDRFHWKHEDVELMQFIGLNDGNGKPIFEGDIINFQGNYTSHEKCGWKTGSVEYDKNNASFVIKVPNLDPYSINDETDEFYYKSEVIGNIYQNPELIKDAADTSS